MKTQSLGGQFFNTIVSIGAVVFATLAIVIWSTAVPLQAQGVVEQSAASARDTATRDGAGLRLGARYGMVRPLDRGMACYVRPGVVEFRCTGGTGAERCIVIERGGRVMSVPVRADVQRVVLPEGWDRNSDTALDDPAPYVATYVVRNGGREERSQPVEIPVRVYDGVRPSRGLPSARAADRYSLCFFGFDAARFSELHERILREHVCEGIGPDAEIEVVGRTDTIGQRDRNVRLSELRAARVADAIGKLVTPSRYRVLAERGLGAEAPLFSNTLPEGRFFNRTIEVFVYNPRSMP